MDRSKDIVSKKAIHRFQRWYEGLTFYKASGGPAKGTIAGALVVLDRLKRDFVPEIESHTTQQGIGSQVAGASGTAVGAILERFGETRPFLREGGRTNRGLKADISRLLKAIEESEVADLAANQREATLTEMQKFLVNRIRDLHGRKRLGFEFDANKTTWQVVGLLLDSARGAGKEGAVAQYLIGAKLQVRFPDRDIGNESFSTADQQLGRHGDFQVEDTVFHVTVSPMSAVYDKCAANLSEGFRTYLLVPDRILAAARQNAEAKSEGRIAVESIESFVSQNIEELGAFSEGRRRSSFHELLDTYNRRVEATESDQSLKIEIPRNLTT